MKDMRMFAVVLLWAAPLLGQGRRPAGVPPRVQQLESSRPRRFMDGIVGIIGDHAILDSTVRRELARETENAKARGETLTKADIARLRQEILATKARQEVFAQGANSLHGTSREQVERVFEDYMRQYEQEQIEKFGSITKFSEELKVLGMTLESIRDEERTRLMARLTEQQNLSRRVRDQLALLVTPAGMHRFYEANRSDFVSLASADITAITIPLGNDPEQAKQRAQAAADAWRAGKEIAELEKRFGAVSRRPFLAVRDDEQDSRAHMIKEFAKSARAGQVSKPRLRGASYWILKVQRLHPAKTRLFSQADVQAEIENLLVNRRLEALRRRLFLRSRRSFYYDIPELVGYRPR